MAESRAGLLVGATGLVGSQLLRRLLDHPDYASVTVWVRRALPQSHPKLVQAIVDFEGLGEGADLRRVDDVFCCLGTTMRKAGSKAAFERVDRDYPGQIARLAKAAGARRFLMVSALGANPRSMVFYNRIKGQAERAVLEAGMPQTLFFRPSLLLGERKEPRPGERAGIAASRLISPLLIGPLRKYRPIAADAVAAAMIHAATQDLQAGIVESDRIPDLAALA